MISLQENRMYILLVTYNVYPTTDNFGIKGRECNPLPHTSIYILYIYIYAYTYVEAQCGAVMS